MSNWVNMSEVNNILGKALESCKDELSPSFYGGARLMLDKINEMAEDTADTPQTKQSNSEYYLELADAVMRGEMSDASANQAWYEYINKQDTPQTERMTEEEIDTMLAKVLVGQTDCGWAEPE